MRGRVRSSLEARRNDVGLVRAGGRTLGAVHGAMETLVGKKLRAKQVGSVLRGQSHDTIELVPA